MAITKPSGKGRRPDYDLVAMYKGDEDSKARVGAGWLAENGGGAIHIKLNGFVDLRGIPDLRLVLFPCDDKKAAARSALQGARFAPRTEPDDDTPY